MTHPLTPSGRAPRWARLTWQAADAVALSGDLERWLGVPSRPHPTLPGARVIELGEMLEIVPWRVEQQGDAPQPRGRLVLEPIVAATLDGTPVPQTTMAPGGPIGSPDGLEIVALAWATVDLDQAAIDLEPWLAPHDRTVEPPDGRDPHLGARTRVRTSAGLPGALLVLAEPDTEGRVSASLARHGEGPCAIYLRPWAGLEPWILGARARQVSLSPQRGGPLGASVLIATTVTGNAASIDIGAPSDTAAPTGTAATRGATILPIGALAGPQIIVVTGGSPASGPAASGTIGP